jgi:dihydropteroate synthase
MILQASSCKPYFDRDGGERRVNSEQFYQWCTQSFSPTVPSSNYLRKPLIMGILNVTPDSFSDGGRFLAVNAAYQQAQCLIEQGADIIDIGGESTKPGADDVSCSEELERVIPVIERIRAVSDVCISIDTCKAAVMKAAVAAGASFINDIKALRAEGALQVAAELKVPVCLMHMQGVPKSMQENPYYANDVVDDINQFFQQRIEACLDVGMSRKNLMVDPGFGFGKSVQHNLCIVKRLVEFQQHGLPVLLGVSRKSTIGAILQKPVLDRLVGGIALEVVAALQGVSIIRTHDVGSTNQALQMVDAIVDGAHFERGWIKFQD